MVYMLVFFFLFDKRFICLYVGFVGRNYKRKKYKKDTQKENQPPRLFLILETSAPVILNAFATTKSGMGGLDVKDASAAS